MNGLSGWQNFQAQDTVPASGTTNVTATQLSSGIAMYSFNTVPVGSGVQLPLCLPGVAKALYNNSANSLIVYPSTVVNPVTGSTDKINNIVSLTMSAQTASLFTCAQPGAWNSISGGAGSSSGVPLASSYPLNAPLIGNGISTIGSGTRSGNTTIFGTTNGVLGNGDCVSIDLNGNLVDAGGPCTTGGGGGTVTTGSASAVTYYKTTSSVVYPSPLSVLYGGNAATTTQVPQLPMAPSNIASGSPLDVQCLTSGAGVLSHFQACTPGFSNLLRNSSLIDFPCLNGQGWEAGQNCTVTITTSGGWCAVGVWCIPVGGSVSCEWFGGNVAILCENVTSATDLKLRYVQESFLSGRMGGQTLTFQMRLQYTGGAFTPTIATAYANNGDADDWSANVTTDLSGTTMQTCQAYSAGVGCYFGYTWSLVTSAPYGYEETIDLNIADNFAGSVEFKPGAWDMRITPEAPIGVAAALPLQEIRDPESDHLWDQRFYQTIVSYDTNSHTAYLPSAIATGTTSASVPLTFPIMRTSPTINCIACGSNQMTVGGQDVTSGSASNITPSSALLSLGASGGGLTTGNAYLVTIGTANVITLNADIPGG